MRRSASEIIRNLERRIARLERTASPVLSSEEQKHLKDLTDSIRRFFQESNTAATIFSKGGGDYEKFAKKLQQMNDLISEVSKELPNQVRSLNKEEVKDPKKASFGGVPSLSTDRMVRTINRKLDKELMGVEIGDLNELKMKKMEFGAGLFQIKGEDVFVVVKSDEGFVEVYSDYRSAYKDMINQFGKSASSKKASRMEAEKAVTRIKLKKAIIFLNDEFGFDENDEEIDLEFSVRDWIYEDSSKTDDGRPIYAFSIESNYNGETFYAVFVENRRGKIKEVGLFDDDRDLHDKIKGLERGF